MLTSSDAALVQTDGDDGDLVDEIPQEVLDRLPPEIVEQLENGTLDQIPDSVIEQLPAGVQDRIPAGLRDQADTTTLAVVLVGVMVLSAVGIWWSITKRLIKLTLFFVIAGIAAFFWYTNR